MVCQCVPSAGPAPTATAGEAYVFYIGSRLAARVSVASHRSQRGTRWVTGAKIITVGMLTS